MKHAEDDLQMACFQWMCLVYPKLARLLHHSPNEGLLKGGVKEGARRKRRGVQAGFPDFIFLLANDEHPYLAIELKTPKGRQSDKQKEYQRLVQATGGKYVVVRSVFEFSQIMKAYISKRSAAGRDIPPKEVALHGWIAALAAFNKNKTPCVDS